MRLAQRLGHHPIHAFHISDDPVWRGQTYLCKSIHSATMQACHTYKHRKSRGFGTSPFKVAHKPTISLLILSCLWRCHFVQKQAQTNTVSIRVARFHHIWGSGENNALVWDFSTLLYSPTAASPPKPSVPCHPLQVVWMEPRKHTVSIFPLCSPNRHWKMQNVRPLTDRLH